MRVYGIQQDTGCPLPYHVRDKLREHDEQEVIPAHAGIQEPYRQSQAALGLSLSPTIESKKYAGLLQLGTGASSTSRHYHISHNERARDTTSLDMRESIWNEREGKITSLDTREATGHHDGLPCPAPQHCAPCPAPRAGGTSDPWARPAQEDSGGIVTRDDYRTGEKAAGISSLLSCRTGRTPVWGGHAP